MTRLEYSEPMTQQLLVQQLLDEKSIRDLLIHYARICDQRDWQALPQIFCEDVSAKYGNEYDLRGLEALTDNLRALLSGCGPTQHLVSNFMINIEDKTATSICYVQTMHAGIKEAEGITYEVWGEYHDKLIYGEQGWRIHDRFLYVTKELGTRAVLTAGH